MKKILWFSRHGMSVIQHEYLVTKFGKIEITQISGSPANVHVAFEATEPERGEIKHEFKIGLQPSLKELATTFDELCVVLPIGLQQQLLPFSVSCRLLQAKSKRILLENGKVDFLFDGWEAITEIKIISEML